MFSRVAHQNTSASGRCRHLKTSGFDSESNTIIWRLFRELILFFIILLYIIEQNVILCVEKVEK
jgi:hypothetical protein